MKIMKTGNRKDKEALYQEGKQKKLLLAIAVFAVLALAYMAGFSPHGTGIRLLWNEKTVGNQWTASYKYFSGIREKKLRLKEAKSLRLDALTDAGELSIEIKDSDGKVLFSQENIQSLEKEIAVNGTVKAKVTANGHKGRFGFRW